MQIIIEFYLIEFYLMSIISLKRGIIQGVMEGFLWIFTRRPDYGFCSREYRP
jgi:hypothetical protein